MSFSPFRWIGQGFRYLWRALDFSRRVLLNLLLLVFFIALLIGIFSGGVKKLEDKTALFWISKGRWLNNTQAMPAKLCSLKHRVTPKRVRNCVTY